MVDKFSDNQELTNVSGQAEDAPSPAFEQRSEADAGLRESLSALMDGEASELELRRILKSSAEDPELKAVWQRYHLISASLSQEAHSKPSVNLLQGIHEQLDLEEQSSGAYPKAPLFGHNMSKMFKRIGQGAVAASVAFSVLYSASYLQNTNVDSGAAATEVAQADSNMPSFGGEFTPSQLSRTVSAGSADSVDAAARDRIQRAVYQFSGNKQTPLGEAYSFPTQDISDSETSEQ